MDLPTYTNIWRIEKRLYKLYDFRLPAPLPINWIAVFAGITIPYIVLLVAIGLPFNHTLVWLYVLPPGVLTWLTTRPVIESKRLPELLESQVRYLAEPKVWCRLAPLSEKDQIVVTARVWHSRRVPQQRRAAAGALALRMRATLAPRRQATAVPAEVAEGPEQMAPAAVMAADVAAASSATAAPPRFRARSRARGTSAEALAPASPAKQRASARQGRPARQGQPGRQPQPPRRAGAAQQAAPRPPSVPEAPAAKPSRFRLSGLGTRPAGPAPALPPGVALKPPAGPGQRPPASRPPLAGPAQGLPPGRFVPSLGPVAAPVASSRPEHATPDVHPVRPAAGRPLVPDAATEPGGPDTVEHADPSAAAVGHAVVPPATGHSTATLPAAPAALNANGHGNPVHPGGAAAADERRAAPAAAAPEAAIQHAADAWVPTAEGAPAEQATGTREPGTPDDAAAPVRVRGGGPRIEVAHTGPARRPMPPAPVPPADPAHGWPAPVRPLHPVPPPEPPSAPPAGIASDTGRLPVDGVVFPDARPAPDRETPPTGLSPVSAAIATETGNINAPAGPEVGERPEAEELPEAETHPGAETRPGAEEQAQAAVVNAVAGAPEKAVPSIERALSGPSRDRNLTWHGKVKIVTGAGATQGPGARDQEALDRTRARLPLNAAKRVLMLGCTSGAGQTVTTLMTGHILASLREEPVAAVDLHDGTLARYSAPAVWLDEILGGKPPQTARAARPDGLRPAPKPNPARLDVIASHDPLRDGDEIKLAVQLNRHYPLTMLDPGAAGLTKLLKITDQLVVVVPASVEGSGALADTREWLDAHGFAELAANSVTLINGVSRRSMGDVEHAESAVRGRCRAIVRVPWDDMLPVGVAGPSTLRAQTRVAYTALAGVLVAGLAAAPIRKQQ